MYPGVGYSHIGNSGNPFHMRYWRAWPDISSCTAPHGHRKARDGACSSRGRWYSPRRTKFLGHTAVCSIKSLSDTTDKTHTIILLLCIPTLTPRGITSATWSGAYSSLSALPWFQCGRMYCLWILGETYRNHSGQRYGVHHGYNQRS